MRKLLCLFLTMTCIFGFCSCSIVETLFKTESLKGRAEEHLNLSLEDATVLEEWDNHGGFHGDGETFVKLSCADGFEENLGSDWQALPLEGAAYEYFYNWGGVLEDPETDEMLIPEIENGYWFYRDTGPMNWELAVYDCDENILYYYEFDA